MWETQGFCWIHERCHFGQGDWWVKVVTWKWCLKCHVKAHSSGLMATCKRPIMCVTEKSQRGNVISDICTWEEAQMQRKTRWHPCKCTQASHLKQEGRHSTQHNSCHLSSFKYTMRPHPDCRAVASVSSGQRSIVSLVIFSYVCSSKWT